MGRGQAWVARWLLLDWVSEANRPRRASTGFAAIQSSAHALCTGSPAWEHIGAGLPHSTQGRSCQRSKCWLSRLPWTDPKWFNAQLREHMSAEHREELTLLLMADS